MEAHENQTTYSNPFEMTVAMETDVEDVRSLARTYLMYKVGIIMNKVYFPVLVPVGIIGNILSFFVMIQPHNRHMSISFYIAALAVTDTIALLLAFTTYLNSIHGVQFPPDQHWFCAIATAVLWASTLSSTLFILSMTFDRVYSIIRPHKAASFNTIKRAKITIVCIILFSSAFNIPYLFIINSTGGYCATDLSQFVKKLFMWLSYVIQFIIPFLSLLSMNSVIIHTLKNRSMGKMTNTKTKSQGHGQCHGQFQSQGQCSNSKSTEGQIYVILLLVAFSFFILISPYYAFHLCTLLLDFTQSPKAFAGRSMFFQIMHKMYFTNNAINFFLYVISGQKFRKDLMNLFNWKERKSKDNSMSTALENSKNAMN